MAASDDALYRLAQQRLNGRGHEKSRVHAYTAPLFGDFVRRKDPTSTA